MELQSIALVFFGAADGLVDFLSACHFAASFRIFFAFVAAPLALTRLCLEAEHVTKAVTFRETKLYQSLILSPAAGTRFVHGFLAWLFQHLAHVQSSTPLRCPSKIPWYSVHKDEHGTTVL